jgi:hypothetical protein
VPAHAGLFLEQLFFGLSAGEGGRRLKTEVQARLLGLASALLWLALGVLAFVALSYHAEACASPYQWVPSEGGLYQSVRALAQGWNPWAPDKAAEYYNAYGIGYPWVVLQLDRLAPSMDLLLLMRLTSAGGLLLASGMAALASRSAGLKIREALGLALVVYCCLLFGDQKYARPDGLLALLYVGAVVWTLRPGLLNALLAGLIAGSAYYFKPQGLLAVPLVLLALALQRRRREAAAAGAAAALAWLGLGALMLVRYPHYFEGTVMLQAAASNPSVLWMFYQWVNLAATHWPLALALPAALGLAAYRRQTLAPQGPAALWAWIALAVFAVLAAGPGEHNGAYMTYYDLLFCPFALIAAALWLSQLGVNRHVLALLLVLDANSALRMAVTETPPRTEAEIQNWQRADAWVQAHPYGIYPGILTTLVVKDHAFVTDTGHSHYLALCKVAQGQSELYDAYSDRMRQIAAGLQQRKFSSLICGDITPCPGNMAALGYHEVQPIYLNGGKLRLSVFALNPI